jgi:hypothetical protein
MVPSPERFSLVAGFAAWPGVSGWKRRVRTARLFIAMRPAGGAIGRGGWPPSIAEDRKFRATWGVTRAWRRSAMNPAASNPLSAPSVRRRVDPGKWRWIMSSAARRSAWPSASVRSPCTIRPEWFSIGARPMKPGMAPVPGDFLLSRASGSVVEAWVHRTASRPRNVLRPFRADTCQRGRFPGAHDLGPDRRAQGPANQRNRRLCCICSISGSSERTKHGIWRRLAPISRPGRIEERP